MTTSYRLAAAKLGRLVLSQLSTPVLQRGCSHWSSRTGIQFSPVHVLRTSLNNSAKAARTVNGSLSTAVLSPFRKRRLGVV